MKPKFRPDGHCSCGHPPQPDIHEPGYGVRANGETACIDCLTDSQRAAMIRDGEASLTVGFTTVHNTPKTLSFPILDESRAGHNIAQGRRTVWFIGPDEMKWTGVHYGEGTGAIHVKRCAGVHALREQLRALGMSLHLKDGEFRVNYRYGAEETAYYTTDPIDAFKTGKRMADERDAPKPIPMEW